ncbi:putative C-S lyase [Silvanigrella paludirubra]|uniref:cysteine-S-conjugate beta-lyase n=1 Tax=Silvanigrella paludirubra TaxID=2499159 RepID=A0A6N6VY49_9BACT|nr:PatB family C-S lyase [Silvanigrella paludirubra]KAB8039025.1 putative C-S lyase [Silvanigrella paludirubra]
MSKYNFDKEFNRIGSSCYKWDGRKKFLGYPDVLPMHVADMDFQCAPEILEVIQERAAHPSFGYAIYDGSHFVTLSEWIFNQHQWKISPSWCLYSPSIVTSLSLCIHSLTTENEGIIIQTPIYPPFMEVIRNNKRNLLVNRLKLNANGNYEINFDDFEDLCKNKNAKMFILCSPHNPVGRVWTKNELIKISEICLKYNIIIVSDEIHSDLVYKPNKHINISSISNEVSQNTITCISPSKTFNIPGISSSAIIIENKILRNKLNSSIDKFHLFLPSVFSVLAFDAAYKFGNNWYQNLMLYLENNQSILKKWSIENHEYIDYSSPEATYLGWLSFKKIKLNDSELKKFIYEKAHVALDPGSRFGTGGENFMRINFACPKSQLETALHKLKCALNSI